MDNENFSEMSAEEQADVIAKQFLQEEEPEQEPGEEGQMQQEPEQSEVVEEETAATQEIHTDANKYYSLEEFVTANPLDVDPERLPDGARLVHKRYMEFYEREVAPLLRELETLKAAGQQPNKDTLVEEVQREAMRRLGVQELDTYDANHITMLNLVSREIADQRAEQQSERQRLVSVAAEIQNSPDFAAVDRFAQTQIQQMPKANADTILREIYSGDPARIRAVYDAFQKKYAEIKSNPTPKKAAPEVPPSVIPGSNAGEKETPKFGYDDFSRASSKEQADMLISMGLIDNIEQ